MRNIILSVAFLSCIVVSTVSAATLTGSTVTAGLYCCTTPTDDNRVSDIVTDTVGSHIEFPVNTFTFINDGDTWDEGSIDIGPNTILLELFTSGTTNPGTFNGFIFSFTGAPTITGVSADPSSTLMPTDLFFTSDTIFVNIASKPYTPGTAFILNVAMGPVPVPASALLFISGIIVLVSLRFKKAIGDRLQFSPI